MGQQVLRYRTMDLGNALLTLNREDIRQIGRICGNQTLPLSLHRSMLNIIQENEIWVKDLNRLGRPIEKAIIVDYDKRIFNRNPKNGV